MKLRSLLLITLSLACSSIQANSTLELTRDWREAMPASATRGEQALVQISNSRLALSDNIWFQVEQLHGTVKPGKANTPVSLEDPSAFEVQVDNARLRISDAVLQSLVQDELQRTDSPLRIKKVRTQPDGIEITGDIKRLGLWIPFSMQGTPRVENSQELALTPSSLKVAGLPVYKALLATNLQLQSLINMKSKAVVLEGQAMVLKLQHVLLAPRIEFDLNTVQLGQGEVMLAMGHTEQSANFFCKSDCPGNFVYTEGGELRAAGMVLSGQPTLVTGVASGALPVQLHKLHQLISTSTVQLRTDGALWISAQEGSLAAEDQYLLNTGEQTIALLEKMLGAASTDESVTLAVHHATLLSAEGIELRVEKLLASTQSTDLGQLPTSRQTVHVGEIALSQNAMNTLMNKALFNYPGSPIQKVASTIEDPLLKLDLQVKPQLLGIPLFWLPASLRGELIVAADQMHLEFTPSEVRMFGMSMLPVIRFMGMQLESLIKIDEAAVKLRGNTIRIGLNNALPPLQLNTRLHTIKPVLRSPLGPYLQVHVGMLEPEKIGEIYNTMELLPLGLWMNTPEFTALGMRTGPTLGHVHNTPRNERLVIDLSKYPDLLTSATLRLPKPERVWVSMPSALVGSQYPVQGHGHKDQAHQVPHHHQ